MTFVIPIGVSQPVKKLDYKIYFIIELANER